MQDRRLIFAAAFLRALAVGMTGVLLGVFLASKGMDPAKTGGAVASGLAGGAVAALIVTVAGDRLGRKRSLIVLSILAGAGTLGLAVSRNFAVASLFAFAGMVNGMGRDRGAALVLDQAILPARTPPDQRTRVFAWYNALQDSGHACGGLLVALLGLLAAKAAWSQPLALEGALILSGVILAGSALCYAALSPGVESPAPRAGLRVSPGSRGLLIRICGLFAVDAVAGGFLTAALLAYFFVERFGVGLGEVGALFFAARVANAGSHLLAAWLARRIGLVNTMVFTHLPSSLLLVTVPFAPSFPLAAALFLIRESLVEMDVPTRQSYVMAVVRPEERTFAAGATHLVRLAGWAIAPAFAGALMGAGALWAPLVIGAAMKIAYDVALYFAFRGIRPPEEAPSRSPEPSSG